jgi:glucose-6-phosphate isomerase
LSESTKRIPLADHRPVSSLSTSRAWASLRAHHATVADLHLRELFASDPERLGVLTVEAAGVYADFSKHRITTETVPLLTALARERGVEERRDAMFRGDHINTTEDRAVLHVALRMPRERSLVVDGVDVVREVHDVLDRMAATASAAATGAGRPEGRSATWSTSASAARISGRRWPTRRCASTVVAT